MNRLKDLIEQDVQESINPALLGFVTKSSTDAALAQHCPWVEPLAAKLNVTRVPVRYVMPMGASTSQAVGEVLLPGSAYDKIEPDYAKQAAVSVAKLILDGVTYTLVTKEI